MERIYIDAATTIILHDRSLKLLQHTCESQHWPDLSSWVPAWDEPEDGYDITRSPFRASKRGGAKFAFLNGDRSMSVRGRFIDRMSRRAERYLAGEKEAAGFPELRSGQDSEIA